MGAQSPIIVAVQDKETRDYLSKLNAGIIGVDSFYIYRVREIFDSAEGKALMDKWGVQGDYEGIGNVILGYGLAGRHQGSNTQKRRLYHPCMIFNLTFGSPLL